MRSRTTPPTPAALALLWALPVVLAVLAVVCARNDAAFTAASAPTTVSVLGIRTIAGAKQHDYLLRVTTDATAPGGTQVVTKRVDALVGSGLQPGSTLTARVGRGGDHEVRLDSELNTGPQLGLAAAVTALLAILVSVTAHRQRRMSAGRRRGRPRR